MSEKDIIEIESQLGIRLPVAYRQFMLLAAQRIPAIFFEVPKIIATNQSNRQMSWLGRPLDRAFFIFGADEHGRELFLDLDFPEPMVMVADHVHRRGSVVARSFDDLISRYDHPS